MDHADFQDGIELLRSYYGESSYQGAQPRILWNLVHKLTAAEFAQVIDRLVEEHPRTPTVASIKKCAGPFLRAAASREDQGAIRELEANGRSCSYCQHTGMIESVNRESGMSYSFRCPYCPAARTRRLSLSIPEWTPDVARTHVPFTPKSMPEAIAIQRSREEQTVLLNWLKRVRTNPNAARRFAEAGGILPDQVIDALTRLGFDVGPVEKAKEALEARLLRLRKVLDAGKFKPEEFF